MLWQPLESSPRGAGGESCPETLWPRLCRPRLRAVFPEGLPALWTPGSSLGKGIVFLVGVFVLSHSDMSQCYVITTAKQDRSCHMPQIWGSLDAYEELKDAKPFLDWARQQGLLLGVCISDCDVGLKGRRKAQGAQKRTPRSRDDLGRYIHEPIIPERDEPLVWLHSSIATTWVWKLTERYGSGRWFLRFEKHIVQKQKTKTRKPARPPTSRSTSWKRNIYISIQTNLSPP